jgi:molybdopterin synthase catalytic subunit
VKATVPIWKRETWAGGSDWGEHSRAIVDLSDLEIP